MRVGAVVESLVNMQGMKLGSRYEVIDVLRNVTSLGTFETVVLRPSPCGCALLTDGHRCRVIRVNNAHLVLKEVSP